jgi:hypothetical protein
MKHFFFSISKKSVGAVNFFFYLKKKHSGDGSIFKEIKKFSRLGSLIRMSLVN